MGDVRVLIRGYEIKGAFDLQRAGEIRKAVSEEIDKYATSGGNYGIAKRFSLPGLKGDIRMLVEVRGCINPVVSIEVRIPGAKEPAYLGKLLKKIEAGDPLVEERKSMSELVP